MSDKTDTSNVKSEKNMNDVTVTLYYANWCGHCVKFKPTWEELKLRVDNLNGSKELEDKLISKITLKEYEDSEIKGNLELQKKVEGFPTIVITVANKDIKFEGERSIDNILKAVYESIDVSMTLTDSASDPESSKGDKQDGGSRVDYRKKYHKYKAMYAELVEKYKKLKFKNN